MSLTNKKSRLDIDNFPEVFVSSSLWTETGVLLEL